MNDIPTNHLVGWGILAFFGVWWLGWLFTRGMAASRKDHAIKTGDASGLTLEDREENRAAFVRELSRPAPPKAGSSMETAKACATLGVVITGAGMALSLFTDWGTSVSSLLLCVGLLLVLLGGAVALGGGK